MLVICLTVFSIGLSANSLTLTDILPTPVIILAIIFLFKKNYFLSGLMLGVAAAIKWQPVVLIPIFGLTIFNFRDKFPQSAFSALKFILGLTIVSVGVWGLILSYPLGKEAFDRCVVNFLLVGPPFLSGQAMNLNWVVGYLMHIFQPEKVESLVMNGWINTYFGASIAPKIFQGYLFYLATAAILLKYWLSYKKDLPHFLSATIMVYFSHYMLNKGVHSYHAFYVVLPMLLLYAINPTPKNRLMLILFDVMAFLNLFLFMGLLGPADINRVFLRLDITVIFAAYYLVIYLIILRDYFKFKGLFLN